MKILIIQENGHHDKNRNFRECFCMKRGLEHHGVSADVWGKEHANFDVEPEWESYDLILAIENWDWMPDISKIKTKKFIWAIDAHCKGPQIYEQYGFYHESLLCLNYYGEEGGKKIRRIMDHFRDFKAGEILGDKITKLEDYLNQRVTDFTDNTAATIDLPVSNVLGFTFESGNKLYLRPSGTEPKIKFYVSVNAPLENVPGYPAAHADLEAKIDRILAELKLEA